MIIPEGRGRIEKGVRRKFLLLDEEPLEDEGLTFLSHLLNQIPLLLFEPVDEGVLGQVVENFLTLDEEVSFVSVGGEGE